MGTGCSCYCTVCSESHIEPSSDRNQQLAVAIAIFFFRRCRRHTSPVFGQQLAVHAVDLPLFLARRHLPAHAFAVGIIRVATYLSGVISRSRHAVLSIKSRVAVARSEER